MQPRVEMKIPPESELPAAVALAVAGIVVEVVRTVTQIPRIKAEPCHGELIGTRCTVVVQLGTIADVIFVGSSCVFHQSSILPSCIMIIGDTCPIVPHLMP